MDHEKHIELRVGHLIGVPSDDGPVLGQVLFFSQSTPGMAIMRVWAVDAMSSRDGIPSDDGPTYVLFLGIGRAQTGEWPIVGHVELDKAAEALTEYYSGGCVFIGDTYIRPATTEERQLLPHRSVLGNKAVTIITTRIRRGMPVPRGYSRAESR